MLHSPNVTLDKYSVSLRTGFLPSVPPLQKLENAYYWPWEDIVWDLPSHIQCRTIRQAVEELPILSTSKLHEEPEWRRAYLLLAYLMHAYIWGGERPKDVLPPSISCPFLEVSNHLELPPCATYAALNLWNFAVSDHTADMTDPENLYVTASFTGTKDEEWFLMVSVAIEAKGAQLIPLMLEAFHAASVDDAQRRAAKTWLQQDCQMVSSTMKGTERSNGATKPPAKTAFMLEMRNYMPGPHRRFLEMMSRASNIRAYAMSHKADSPVRDAYNAAVMSLGLFRDSHIKMVTRYIIMAAKMKPTNTMPSQVNLATSTTTRMEGLNEKVSGGLHGTGGTDLIPFLKKTRDTTKAAALYTD
ncbi:hypothetical protein EYZ11_009830 [Aspergillus tanneri]|uniref:Indoleamine 2,3-dioxygenase n=1 Tax=Aspergillus tanneri TaxID=1220188 RepID=A0A4S3J6Y5_9EURO|nr:hypothetical protein EYZ11_009830 [Aspergillus tanneri]